MYVDASALVAILNREPEADDLLRKLLGTKTQRFICGVTIFETITSLARSRTPLKRAVSKTTLEQARRAVMQLIESLDIREVAVTPTIAQGAYEAALTYGKIVAHKADLNTGDCFAYATAKAYRVSLLYKGNDFVLTDLG